MIDAKHRESGFETAAEKRVHALWRRCLLTLCAGLGLAVLVALLAHGSW